jgi:hypothetical protein
MHILFKIYVVWSCCEIIYVLHIRGSFFAHVQTGPGTHPASRTMGTRSFPGVRWPGHGADHPPLLAPKLRMSRAIPLLPL